ncbi:MAG: hypothetical protein KDJ65_06005 [Anaerolineae bacterium]|nr:hypothetical protein [Anaerolineae bacterium]
MNLSVIALQSHPPQFFAQCPTTQQHVAVRDSQDFDIVNQHGTWWRCTDCGGWHVSLDKHVPEKTDIVNVLEGVV